LSTLNLQLNTGAARSELSAVISNLDKLKTSLDNVGKSKGFATTLDKLAGFKGVEARAVQSLNALATGMQQASAAASTVNNVSKSLNTLARIRVDSIASNLERVTRALAGLRVPPSVARFATDMQRVAQASGLAANGVMRVGRALNTIRAAPGLTSTARGMERIAASAAGATTGLNTFARAGSTASSILSGFGVVLGGVGFARIVTGSYDAVRSMEAFKNSVAATQGSTEAANREWDYVTGVAQSLRLSIDGVAKSYGSFAASAHLAGVSTADTHKIFEAMSGAARVLNMDSQQVELSFNALSQMFSKGTVGAEELRQQLGDHLPGAMQLMAQAVGVSTGELMKMMSQGEVLASSALPKFADVLIERYGAQVPNALNSAQAAFTNFGNAMTLASQAFGTGFFDSFKDSLNGLAETMQNPAFIQSAYAWGQALGAAANVALQAIKLVADNFDWLKYAVLGVVGLKLGSTIAGWSASFWALAASAGAVTRTVSGVTVTIGAMGGLAGVFTMLRTGLTAAAGAAALFVRSLGPIGLGITALTVAIPLAIDLYNRWAKSSDQVAKASNGTANGANKAAAAAENVANSSSKGASGLSGLAQQLFGVVAPANAAASALNGAAKAAVNFVSVGSSAADLANYMRSGSGGGVSVLSSPEEVDEYNGYKFGGIAGKPTGLTYHLPASAFFNAPRFAGGGLSDGGIPAVLHPNEAVVPLTGGGEIPVANMSAGQSSLLLLKPLTLLVDYAKQTKMEVSRVWEATTNQTVLAKNALDRIETTLSHIDNSRFPELGNAFTTAISNLSSFMGSGTYYSSSGGVAAGRTAAGNDAGQVDKLFRYLDVAAQTGTFPTGTGMMSGGSGLVMVDGKVMAANSPTYAAALAEKVRAEVEKIKAFVNAGYYSDAEINKLVQQWDKDKKRMRGFATGSPNAWKDATGGFTATLHPDEAVIPLPDGRAVPVDMPSSFIKRVQQIISEGDARVMNSVRSVAGNGGDGPAFAVNVTMNVNAKDAASFRESQDQIYREMEAKMARAIRRTGRKLDVEDPTKRA